MAVTKKQTDTTVFIMIISKIEGGGFASAL